jgi:large conductance mechanosensitive channel
MLKAFKEISLRSDLITVAVGLAMALAGFTLVQATVGGLIAPLISVFVGDEFFATSSFTIFDNNFTYGVVVEDAITFALVMAAAYFLLVMRFQRLQGEGGSTATRACPECTNLISVAAKRCPHCTAVVSAG